MTIFYDDALPLFAQVVSKSLGQDALLLNIFLRDATGRLTFIAIQKIPAKKLSDIARQAAHLRPYVANAEEAVATPDQLFDGEVFTSTAGHIEFLDHPAFTGFARIFERRIVGQDWLTAPREPIVGLPPVVVFASHKGGVGRSTALAVAASSFASSNLNVLAVDLDLEAPGIGSMLLNGDSLPEFGALDFFVENGLQDPDIGLLQSIVGISPLTSGRGIVHVVPATGTRSKKFPQNVLGKIARAYLDDPSEANKPKTFLDQTRDLLAAVSNMNRYDVVLIDVRAGLNETTAASILGLGADILFFGVNAPQTFEGYRYLLSHLAFFKPNESTQPDWRFRLKMVHAKASAKLEDWQAFRDASFNLFAEQIYDVDVTGDAFNFDIDDPNAPHSPWPILNDSNYLEFDPIKNRDQLSSNFYERTFDVFINGLRDRLALVK